MDWGFPWGYCARDLLRVPGLFSLSRVPLAAAFPFAVHRPLAAVAILAAAGSSDVLDGWYARRFRQVTATGAAIDPMTDKIFVLTVAITLVVAGRLAWIDVLLLSTREAAELPLVLWIATSTRARRLRAAHPSANVPGKLATVFQFATSTGAVFGVARLHWMSMATAMVGAFAAAAYWRRSVRHAHAGRGQVLP